MNQASASAVTAASGIWERLRKRTEALAGAWVVRWNSAQSAFAAELAWQEAQAKAPTVSLPAVTPVAVSGLLIEISTRSIRRLQIGMNEVGALRLKVEGDSATLWDPTLRKSQALCSGETFSSNEGTYLLKLFSFSTEVQ